MIRRRLLYRHLLIATQSFLFDLVKVCLQLLKRRGGLLFLLVLLVEPKVLVIKQFCLEVVFVAHDLLLSIIVKIRCEVHEIV